MECEELEKSSDTLTRERDANRINYMYAQYVKNTMEPLNIPDVSKDKRFPWTNENTGNVNQQCIRSLLCTPIKNGKKNKVIGVCQLVNKMEENTGKVKPFNRNDEQFLEAFVIFCGLGIQNTQMYERWREPWPSKWSHWRFCHITLQQQKKKQESCNP